MENDEDVLLVAGSKKRPLIFSKSVYEGKRLLDIRKFYTDKKTGEVKPTRKGVALNNTHFNTLIQFTETHGNEVQEWLESEELTDAAKKVFLEHELADKAKFEHQTISVSYAAGNGIDFIEVIPKGGKLEIVLNTKNNWVKKLQEMETSAKQHVELLLDSLAQSLQLINFQDEYSNEIIETLVSNWGFIMEKKLRENF